MRINKIRIISILSLVVFLISHITNIVYADNTSFGEYQYIYDAKGNPIVTIKIDNEGRIYFRGYHAKSTSGITYHTTGFTLALHKSVNKDPNNLENKVYLDRNEDDGNAGNFPKTIIEDDNLTIDTYLLHSNDVVTALLNLLKKEGYTKQQAYKELSKGVTIYFSNIFEIIDRNTKKRIGNEQYYSYDNINEAVYKLTGSSWSELTQKLLGAYYDNPLQIKLNPFTYNVLYVDAQDYAKKGTDATTLFRGESDQLVMFGQRAQASLLVSSKLKYKGVQYQYSGADYVYDNGQRNTSNPPSMSDGVMSAYHGQKSDATLYILMTKDTTAVTPTVAPSAPPSPTGIVTPNVSANSISYFDADSIGVIQTDTNKTTGYNAISGIPTSEYLYGSIQTSEYLLNIQYRIKSGLISYPITVSKTYHLIKPSSEIIPNQGSPSNPIPSPTMKPNKNNSTSLEPEIELVTKTQSGTITRSYQYIEIASIDYYKIVNGSLTNAALPGNTLMLTPSGYSIPSLSYEHYDGEANHIKSPSNVGGTITLDSETVTEIPNEDLIWQGEGHVGSIQVRNDRLVFDGNLVLNSSWASQNAPSISVNAIRPPDKIASQVLYQGNQRIALDIANGIYPSSGTITYEKVVEFQSTMPFTITYPIAVNTVQIHTPVYCEPKITQDNGTYLQLDNPDLTCTPLIIDEDSITSDLFLHISNQGYHNSKPGYGNQNYSSYVASEDGKLKNEVRFPVDCYEDTGNDNDTSNDTLIPAGEWTILSSANQRYYLPMWVQEGKYTVEVRSVAQNGEGELDKTQTLANQAMTSYVATNSFDIEVSGRLYGLTLYHVKDYPLWEKVFLSSNPLKMKRNLVSNQLQLIPNGVSKLTYDPAAVYDYRVGTVDRNGQTTSRLSKYTFPLLNGSHPQYSNQGLLKSGYLSSFLIHTNGNVMAKEGARLEITPRFYYVDASDKNREEVDLYYKGSINGTNYSLIKVGSALDLQNKKVYTVGSENLKIPAKELEMTAAIQGLTVNQLKSIKQELYSYSMINLSSTFRTYSNLAYASKHQSANHSKEELARLKQTYYFQYSLPNGVRAVKQGTDVEAYAFKHGITYQEEFWKEKGYLIVNFDIKAYDKDGNLRYSYTNKENYLSNGFCSMWLLEGYQLTKTDYTGSEFNFLLGDVLLYDTDTTASDDYASSGIY